MTDHPVDPHYTATGRWVCLTCKGNATHTPAGWVHR